MNQTLKHLPFDAVWKMRIDHPYSLFVRDGASLWSCGQCPLNEAGEVLHPNDLFAQARAVTGFIDQFLAKVGADAAAISQLVVYHVKTSDTDGEQLRGLFRQHFGRDVVVLPVSIPHFYYDGMMIEVDVFGSTDKKTIYVFKDDETATELTLVDAGDITWANVLFPSGDDIEGALERLLSQAGLALSAALSEQWFVASNRIAQKVSRLRENVDFDPCRIVGISKDGFAAMFSVSFTPAPASQRYIQAGEHGEPGVEIWLARSGDYFDLTGRSLEAVGLVQQTQKIMRAVEWTLRDEALSFEAVRKATTHYIAGSSAEELHDNMNVRNGYYRKPGPASTGLPVYSFPVADPSKISIRLHGKVPAVPGA